MASETGFEADAQTTVPSDSTPVQDPSKNRPVSLERLEEIAIEACDNTLQFADSYQHPLAGQWNTNIIQSALSLLIKESTSCKFIVTSTVIQHTTPPAPLEPKPADTVTSDDKLSSSVEAMSLGAREQEYKIGRRGLHSATGAYWNNEKDGTWSSQYKGAEKKGFDVIVTVFWISIV